MKKIFSLLTIGLLGVCTLTAQTNIVKDPFFTEPFLYNSSAETDKWIHVIKDNVVAGEMKRVLLNGFNDSVVYCKASYITPASNNRSNCYFSQRITSFQQKKYRVSFWLWLNSRDTYVTAEVRYFNENLTSETGTLAQQVIIQSKSSSSAMYHIPGNWVQYTMDLDFTGVTDPERLKVARFTIFPNCSNGTTQARLCEYYIAETQIYEISDSQTEYVKDNEFMTWNRSNGFGGESPNWEVIKGTGASAKRGPGHRDTDYGYEIATVTDHDGTVLCSKPGVVTIPRSGVKLSFYGRSQEVGGTLNVYLGSKLIGTIALSPIWNRYELVTDYSSMDQSAMDQIRFELTKANTYTIDGIWLERADAPSTDVPVVPMEDVVIYTQSRDLIISGGEGMIEVFDLLGKKHLSEPKFADEHFVASLPYSGIYIVQIRNGASMHVQKITI